MSYTKSSHATYDCRYHIVWITKYRRKCLSDDLQSTIKKVLEWVCKELYITIIAMGMEDDHVHLYLRTPLTKSIPYIVKALKWRSSRVVWKDTNHRNYLKSYYWTSGTALWAVGYFVSTVGVVDGEVIKNYVELQWKEDTEGIEIEL
jgi:putative transposase